MKLPFIPSFNLPYVTRSKKKPGLAPGTLVYTGKQKAVKTIIELFAYDKDSFTEQRFDRVEDCIEAVVPGKRNWINIDGLHDADVVATIGGKFNLHPLLMEDILHTEQRPKLDEYDDGRSVFIVTRMVYAQDDKVETEQVSIVMGEDFLVTFQERPGDVFDPIRERIRNGKGRVRTRGCDWLAYVLLDTVVDHYFVLLERWGDAVEAVENHVMEVPDRSDLINIHRLKQGLIVLRKSMWPMRDLTGRITKGDIAYFGKETLLYVRDLYDHTVQAMDTVDTYRDILSGLHDMYMTFVSNRMNEVIKVLTIISTIFIPLTFIAGIYGMNFDFMPELRWRYGYFVLLGVMLIIAIVMLIYFKRRKWL